VNGGDSEVNPKQKALNYWQKKIHNKVPQFIEGMASSPMPTADLQDLQQLCSTLFSKKGLLG
ncbi:hypothetical protein A2U01_0061097, partial [Trifolium medium]|nr:hypothetical protein [Trifolium medium]